MTRRRLAPVLWLLLAPAALAVPLRAADADCLACHEDAKAVETSIHGAPGVACTDCHAGLAGVTEFPHGEAGGPACATCHAEAQEQVAASAHDAQGGPRCWTCHGAHDVLAASEEASKVHPRNLPRTCLPCHADPVFAAAHDLEPREKAELYERGVHHQKLLAGDAMAPTCSTCHGAHDVASTKSPSSPLARANVASFCGGCHPDQLAQYETSVHGKDLAAGNPDVPSCLGCHGEHAIRSPEDPQAPTAPRHVARTCSGCHDDATLAATYGLTPTTLRTYIGSYHGVANRFGETTVANCASCHGAHAILPSADPQSTIHPDNLARTCGACHPQAGRNFAQGKIHAEATREGNYWAWLVRKAYLGLIGGVIGLFLAFILVDLWWRARRRLARREGGA